MKDARILILIGGHLSTSPRGQKEALALREAGCEVEVSGIWFDSEKIAADRRIMTSIGLRFTPALDFSGGSLPGEARRFRTRWRSQKARKNLDRRGAFSPDLLGYGARELGALALQRNADLTIVHSEAGLWAGNELLRAGRPVGIDFEDWFSRDLPLESRRERPVRMLEQLEAALARESRYVLATSQSMAFALAQAYGGATPTVVYNAFPDPPLLSPTALYRVTPSIHWFSQNIGRHRGLELFFRALPRLEHPAWIHLRGSCDRETRRWLERLIPPKWRDRVTIAPPVPAAQLAYRIAEHDIGLALEDATIPSRNLSISNKVFQYLQSGLAVMATPTAGQREALEPCGEAATILAQATPEDLARALNRYLAEPEFLAVAKRAARLASQNLFSWEGEKAKLISAAKRALNG